MSYALGFDASTQSFSALLLDLSVPMVAGSLSVSFAELPEFESPHGFRKGPREGEIHADPRMWLTAWELLLERMNAAAWPLEQVAVVSGSAQQHGSVYLNTRFANTITKLDPGRSLAEQLETSFSRFSSPIWMDCSTSQECREIGMAAGGAERVSQWSGSIPAERFAGPQIRAFYQRYPTGYEATERIHLISSFLCSVLAGQDAPIEPGDGSGMNLMDLTSQQWRPELLAATSPDLLRRLPPIQPSTTCIGPISDFFVQKYGFSPHCQVQLFTGDNPASLVGMGAATPGTVVVSLGTSDTLFEATEEPAADPQGCCHVFGNPLGGYMTLACIRNGSLAREAMRDQLGVDWGTFEEAGHAVLPENAITLPFIVEESTPKHAAGMKETHPELTAPQRARAFLEGQAFNLKSWLTSQPNALRLTGGASHNDGIAQIFADVFGVPVRRLSLSNSAALGAAMRAALATGACRDTLESALCHANSSLEPKDHASCQKRYEHWKAELIR